MSGLFLEETTILVKALDEAPSSSTCSERTQERARIHRREVVRHHVRSSTSPPCVLVCKFRHLLGFQKIEGSVIVTNQTHFVSIMFEIHLNQYI